MSKNHLQLQLLQLSLGFVPALTNSKDFDDVVLIAIDFENLRNIRKDSSQNLNCQAGVAILDTKSMVSSPQTAISAFNFVIGSPSYCRNTTKKFLFGETVTIHRKDINPNIEALISRARNNVLIGHGFENDLSILRFLKFDLHSSIVGIIDLQKIAAEIMPSVSVRLGHILEELLCPFEGLHNAGNDAYFTLRALLLLAIKSYPNRIAANNDHRSKLTALEAITQVSIPRRTNRNDKNREKKLKRVQRSQKYQARLRDLETVARIRAERAEKKSKREYDSKIESLFSLTIPIKAAETEDNFQPSVGLERLGSL